MECVKVGKLKKSAGEVDKKVVASLKKLNKLGKKKLHVFKQNKIRFHHRGYYFDYAPKTGLWQRVSRHHPRKWWWASDEANLMDRVNSYVDYIEGFKACYGSERN
jgi:hypothetical protein